MLLSIPRPGSAPQVLLAGIALAIANFAIARSLAELAAPPNTAVLAMWFPSGISVAAMFLFGPWVALGSFAGSIAIEASAGTPVPAVLTTAIANVASEVLCYWLLVRGGGREFSIASVADCTRLAVSATLAGLVSAFIGITGFYVFGVIAAGEYWTSWITWLASVVTGIILMTPFLTIGLRHALPAGRARWEFLAAVATMVVAAFLWQGPFFTRHANEPSLLVAIFASVWIAFRFGPPAMSAAVFAFSLSAVASAAARMPAEAVEHVPASILSLQLMLAGLPMVAYVLAAMVSQQRRSADELRVAQGELVATARRAGMAEVATNVLHNVGNVLNSVNVSAAVVSSRVRSSRTRGLTRVAKLLEEHEHDLAQFLTADAAGRVLPGYLRQLAQVAEEEQREIVAELTSLTRNIDHIKEVVATQQSYAGASTVLEPIRLADLAEDALRMSDESLQRHGVAVVREFDEVPVAELDRARIIQIVVNLISNARAAMVNTPADARRLTLRITAGGGRLRLQVQDCGEGITAENLGRIFSHGFTTRRDGHGFGLHSCVVAAKDMGGQLTAASDGPGCGAVFTLDLPLALPRAA
jgi:two-component system NtrC family sensor kinase